MKKKSEKRELLKVKEAAELLRVSPMTIYRLVKKTEQEKGQIPHYKIGMQYFFEKDELLDWLKRGGAGKKEEKEEVNE